VIDVANVRAPAMLVERVFGGLRTGTQRDPLPGLAQASRLGECADKALHRIRELRLSIGRAAVPHRTSTEAVGVARGTSRRHPVAARNSITRRVAGVVA